MRERLAMWWKQLVCALDGHGGIMPLDGSHEFKRGSYSLCKRCGATVKMIG